MDGLGRLRGSRGKYNITANIIAPAILTLGAVESTAVLTEDQRAAGALWMKQTIPIGGQLGDPERDFAPLHGISGQ
jgi:2-hydroxycyclohexanecarboxyl-CoA dehydrogenase